MKRMTESVDAAFLPKLSRYLEEMERCLQVISHHMQEHNLLLKPSSISYRS